MKKRTSRKLFKYISGNVTVKSEIELNGEQLIKVCETALEIQSAISYSHANWIAEKIYNGLQDISSVEIFGKNEKVLVKINK